MAWTAPRTWVAGEMLTAALLNTHLRDNLLETGPAKVTTQGDMLYATAANALARLAKGSALQVLRMNAGATAPEWGTAITPKRKATNEAVTSSTTLQNDDDLLFAIAANEVWIFLALLFVSGGFSNDIKIAFTVPAAATVIYGGLGELIAGTDLVTTVAAVVSAGPLSFEIETTERMIVVGGYVANGANAGNVQLQFAQNSSGATATTMLAGSSLLAFRHS